MIKSDTLRKSLFRAVILSLSLSIVSYYNPVNAEESYSKEAPVDLVADSLQYDETGQIITAIGEVELVQSGRILRADKIIYDMSSDKVTAVGNVALMEVNGDVHLAESFELSDNMKKGFVEGLNTVLIDGSRFKADKGEKDGNNRTIMYNASYTPCEPCKDNPEKAPLWGIRASKVVYDENERRISYKNARFEVKGVPIAYTPYFSHPDGSVKRKSGFLAPRFGWDSSLGLSVRENYYWDIAPNKDLTIGTEVFSGQFPMLLGEYRHRFSKAKFKVNGSMAWSERTDNIAGENINIDEEFRGHLFVDSLWDMNENWRSGLDVELTSDEQYLRQYNITNDYILENRLYAERFSGRNYFTTQLLSFQDLRVAEQKDEDQPNILPEIYASFYGSPNSALGGRMQAEIHSLGLVREGNGQDVGRVIAKLGWEKQFILPNGIISKLNTDIRGDYYSISDRNEAVSGSGISKSASEFRFFPKLSVESSYPLIKDFENNNLLIEPVIQAVLSPSLKDNFSVPNEDSQDVQLDASNLFSDNRFPGYDRIEDRTHISYGIRSGVYAGDGSSIEGFIGQSYRFSDIDNPFPDGSGLSRKESDFVGQLSAEYKDYFNMDYRFQLAGNDFNSGRHEFDGSYNKGKFSLGARYLYASSVENTDINDSREQINSSVGYYLNKEWRVRGTALYDLGSEPGLRRASFGVDYYGRCVSFSVTAKRTLTTESTGDSDTKIVFSVGLKNLGEFSASGLNEP